MTRFAAVKGEPLPLDADERDALIRDALVRIAAENTKRDALRRWWCRKYNLPTSDPRLLALTEEELYIEFYEDQIESGDLHVGADGDPYRTVHLGHGVSYLVTGNAEIDKIEEEDARERLRAILEGDDDTDDADPTETEQLWPKKQEST